MERSSAAALPEGDSVAFNCKEMQNVEGEPDKGYGKREGLLGAENLKCLLADAEPQKMKSDVNFGQENPPAGGHSSVDSGEHGSSCGQALRNSIVLRNIFKNYSTEFLLASCSLVNQTWNREARIFIRNRRQCAARNPNRLSPSACQTLEDLQVLCRQMMEQGREIPFNRLEMQLGIRDAGCSKDPDCDYGMVHTNLTSEMTLKYLRICGWLPSASSYVLDTITAFVLDHASEIQKLQVPSVVYLERLLTSGSSPYFPKLQELEVLTTSFQPEVVQQNIIRSFYTKSPNLRKFFVYPDIATPQIVPEELYGLLGNLEIILGCFHPKERILPKIVEKKPELRKLTIFEPSERHHATQDMRILLTQLLQSCKYSLQDLICHGEGFLVLPLLARNALKNLANLSLESDVSPSEFWKALRMIDGDNLMPKLKKIEIKLKLFSAGEVKQWPSVNLPPQLRYAYTSVQKLSLDLVFLQPDMLEIKTAFPHLTSLELISCESEGVPCREFWELWPYLEELKTNMKKTSFRGNFDADFVGIHEEEAEWLREMDEEYLNTVHIVPVRPSLLTMQNLRTLCVKLSLFTVPPTMNFGRPLNFISDVTELVALRRVSGEASISCHFERDDDTEHADSE